MAYKNITLDQLMQGLGQVESSGRYNALGPVTKNGDRAHGFSQVMGNNIGPWTQQYFGQRLTPEQFDNNEYAQKAVTRGKLGEYLQKFGNAPDAVSAWFSGRPLRQAGNASDGFLKTPDYVNKVLNAAQGFDPNSMVALAPEGANGSPTASSANPMAAQSISLGDQENQQPLNNIGSTLANMGASIASLDNRGTGIASLNASRVASNLQAQEAAREKQSGWKYQGQTDNKQGFVFSNGKEMKVIPADPAFAGNKSDETSLQKDFAWAGSDPVKMKLVNAAHGIEDKPEMDDSLKSDLGSLWAAGDDTIMSRQDAKSRQEIMAAGIKQIRDAGLDPKEVMANRIAYKGDLADDRRRSTIIGALDTYKGEFLAGAKQAAEYAKKVPDDIQMKPLREAYQWAQKNAGTEAGKAINDLQVALESMNRGYNRAVSTSSNGNVTGEKRIAELFNPALPTKMILSGIGVLTGDVTRLNKFAVEARDNARARRAGKAIPHPEIEDEDKAIQSILGDAPKSKEPAIRNSAAAPSNIRNANDLNNWIQSSGLKKGDKFTLPDGTEGIVP